MEEGLLLETNFIARSKNHQSLEDLSTVCARVSLSGVSGPI